MATKGRQGGAKTGGRKKGTPNKHTAELKTMIREALHNKGGVAYLERQADENPVAFMGLLGKTLPAELRAEAEDGSSVTVILGITRD